MDAITLYQAVSIFQGALVALDRLFEFWLGATFAVIVASHLGSQMINSKFAILIGVLYLLFNTLVILRMTATVRGITFWQDAIRALVTATEFERLYVPTLELPTQIAYFTIFSVGTIGTLYFIRYAYRHNERRFNEEDSLTAPSRPFD